MVINSRKWLETTCLGIVKNDSIIKNSKSWLTIMNNNVSLNAFSLFLWTKGLCCCLFSYCRCFPPPDHIEIILAWVILAGYSRRLLRIRNVMWKKVAVWCILLTWFHRWCLHILHADTGIWFVYINMIILSFRVKFPTRASKASSPAEMKMLHEGNTSKSAWSTS